MFRDIFQRSLIYQWVKYWHHALIQPRVLNLPWLMIVCISVLVQNFAKHIWKWVFSPLSNQYSTVVTQGKCSKDWENSYLLLETVMLRACCHTFRLAIPELDFTMISLYALRDLTSVWMFITPHLFIGCFLPLVVHTVCCLLLGVVIRITWSIAMTLDHE